MNNDELKKKIMEVLMPVIKAGNISCNEENACKKCWFPCEIERTAGRLADALIAAGIGDVKEAEHRAKVLGRTLAIMKGKGLISGVVDDYIVQAENAALREENEALIREADENAALAMQHKMRADDLAKENAALRERLEKAVDKTIVSEMLAKYFDCPCNFSPLDEEMWAYCRDNCVDDNIECWIRVINKKCAELKEEKK